MPERDLSALAAFAAVARHLSFRKAAIELGVSPSALSHRLRTLEDKTGIALLARTTRSVSLTEAGQRLFARLIPAMGEIADALDDLNALRVTPQGLLRINASGPAVRHVLQALITAYARQYPDVKLEITETDVLVDIVAEGFDAGIRFDHVIERDMVSVPIGQPQSFILVASPVYLASAGIPLHPRDLSEHRCLRYRFPSGRVDTWRLRNGNEVLEIDGDGPLVSNSLDLIWQSAIDGLGIALVYKSDVADDLVTGRAIQVLSEWQEPPKQLHLYYPSRRRVSASLRSFLDFNAGRRRLAAGDTKAC